MVRRVTQLGGRRGGQREGSALGRGSDGIALKGGGGQVKQQEARGGAEWDWEECRG